MDIEEVCKKNIGKYVGIGVELLASYVVDRMLITIMYIQV